MIRMPSYQIGITEINTQVRRLGYVSAILSILGNRTLSETLLYDRIQKWSEVHQEDLSAYINPQGLIKSTRMKSGVRNYTEFSVSLGLVAKVAGAYRVTRFGKVVLPFIAARRTPNPFKLSVAEKLTYFYWLVAKDTDRLFTVLNLLKAKPDTKLSTLQESFQDHYLRFLDARISAERERVAQEILAVRNTVSRTWSSPKRYAESIVPPRLNWLVDIGLVEITTTGQKRTNLTDAGNKMLRRLSDRNGFRYPDARWMNEGFFSTMGTILARVVGKKWSDLSKAEMDGHLLQETQEAFDLLRTSSAPKVSLQPALIYIALKLASKNKIWVDTYSLRKELEERANDSNFTYDVRFSYRENESYLIVRPA